MWSLKIKSANHYNISKLRISILTNSLRLIKNNIQNNILMQITMQSFSKQSNNFTKRNNILSH